MTILTDQRLSGQHRLSSQHRLLTDYRTPTAPPVRRSRRATHERRRYVLGAAPQGGSHGSAGACVDRAHRDETISWTAMVVGVLATALVILGFVAVANLRAASLDSASTPAVTTVEQGQLPTVPALP